ncbi:MAG: S41 family peptidase [Candidatus Peribacteraceae bacterium]|jgi:carboxyl-terminal processing protease|nr:S41 family peptidase [Candidatus Peribacteraceae bacterium]MDP7454262.1 S41 family peptidase [Candidatus Peribacteraceae bacterium]MDP7645752.1 S41 family peptidase [Candidatus Peribacteraceae bacterium]
MLKPLRIATLIILPLITLVLGWQLGVRYEQRHVVEMTEKLELLYTGKSMSGALLADPEREVDLSLLWGVWRLLLAHYIDPDMLNPPEMVYGAVGGLVGSVGDPYTTFMTPSENSDFQKALQGKLEGIGAELTMRDSLVVVVAPLKGSPASKAGLEPEDVITHVNSKNIAGQTLHQVVQLIRGPKGSKIELTIARTDAPEPIKIQIIRTSIQVPSVEYEIKKTETGSVGYIALNQFGEDSVNEIKTALDIMRGADLAGLILDLRFNGGGYLEGSVEMSSMFLNEGKVVTVERRNGDPTHHYVSGRPSDPDIPMVVMINEGSASASEILAGVLQDHERATIVGKKSFGKGTVQEVFDLPGNASVRMTIARWLTPDGNDLGKGGVYPDIEVDRTREQIIDEVDPQLDAAIEFLVDGERPDEIES